MDFLEYSDVTAEVKGVMVRNLKKKSFTARILLRILAGVLTNIMKPFHKFFFVLFCFN